MIAYIQVLREAVLHEDRLEASCKTDYWHAFPPVFTPQTRAKLDFHRGESRRVPGRIQHYAPDNPHSIGALTHDLVKALIREIDRKYVRPKEKEMALPIVLFKTMFTFSLAQLESRLERVLKSSDDGLKMGEVGMVTQSAKRLTN